LTVRESEAEVVRKIVDRFLAGESVRSLAAWMNEQEIPTTTGGLNWRTTTVRGILRSGRIAGLRDHHGEAAGPAAWPALVSEAKHHQILAMFETKKNSGRRAPRRYLLSGRLRCRKCGAPLYSAARADRRRYVCLSGPDHRGCGRLTVVAQPAVEELIATAVLMRLDTPVMGDALSGRAAADERQAALLAELQSAQSKMTELVEMWAAGEMSRPEWKAARTPLEARVANAQKQLDQITGTNAFDGLVGHGEELSAGWDGSEPRPTGRAHPGRAGLRDDPAGVLGARTVDPSRVVPSWQL
jgi:site-specific DNA recombinase